MHIKEFKIVGLYKYLNYSIPFNKGINIIHGINGKGKTTILNIISNILNGELSKFYQLSFKNIHIKFNDSMYVKIYRCIVDNKSKILFDYKLGDEKVFLEKDVSNGNSTKAFKKKIKITPLLLPAQRVSLGETYYHDNSYNQRRYMTIFERNKYLREKRISESRSVFEPIPNMVDISSISEQIIEKARRFSFLISRKFSEYDNKLFEDFFGNILIDKNHKEYKHSSYFDEMNEIPSDNQRENISFNKIKDIKKAKEKYFDSYKRHYKKSKILESIESHISNLDNESEEINIFLDLYLRNINEKNDAIEKFITPFINFENIVNSLFQGKELNISVTGNIRGIFKITSEAKEDIEIQYLSSGEKNLLLIFYHYMLEMGDKTIFMIDEPELSLHIDWQANIINYFDQHSRKNQVLVVTHSPDILQNHRKYEINLDLCRD